MNLTPSILGGKTTAHPKKQKSVTQMPLVADRDIRQVFGLTDAAIGHVIGKTRQAINLGLDKSDVYFRPHEWTLLILYLRARRHPALDQLIDFVTRRYQNAQEIVSAFGVLDGGIPIIQAQVVYAVVADYRHFSIENREASLWLIELSKRRNILFYFLTSSQTDLEMFAGRLGESSSLSPQQASNIRCAWLAEANQYPYLLCCDPEKLNEEYFVCIGGTFKPLDSLRGQTMFQYIKKDLIRTSFSSPIVTQDSEVFA